MSKILVKNLAEKCFGHHAYTHGLYPSDIAINEQLLSVPLIVSDDLSRKGIMSIFASLNLKPSEAYIKRFRSEAIFIGMAKETRGEPSQFTCAEVASVILSQLTEFVIEFDYTDIVC